MCGPLGTVTELDSNSNADELFKLDGLSGLPLKNVCDGEGELFGMYLLWLKLVFCGFFLDPAP
jgi:hypothetical protein